MTVEMMPSARQIALANVVVDIEKGAARVGWDHAPSIYALVPTAMLLADPNLPADIAEQLRGGWDGSEDHLSAIIQKDLDTDDIEQVLAHLAWPEAVPGAALTVERIVVPPEVEDEAPEDPEEALEFISNHPARTATTHNKQITMTPTAANGMARSTLRFRRFARLFAVKRGSFDSFKTE